MKEILKNNFIKSIDTLYNEISLFENENDLWISSKNITNSAGNLCLHLIGNINHFIGAVIDNNGYVRQRENEFKIKNIERNHLLLELVNLKKIIDNMFQNIKEVYLFEVYPLNTFGENKSVLEVFLILIAHFNYHLGQINYFRRLL